MDGNLFRIYLALTYPLTNIIVPIDSYLKLIDVYLCVAGVICFCNMADCASTNYLCRSDGMGCFSDLNDNQDFSKAVHGCLDFLSW